MLENSLSDKWNSGKGRRGMISLLEGLQKPCGCSRVDQEKSIPRVAFGVEFTGGDCGNLREWLSLGIYIKRERDGEIERALCSWSIC